MTYLYYENILQACVERKDKTSQSHINRRYLHEHQLSSSPYPVVPQDYQSLQPALHQRTECPRSSSNEQSPLVSAQVVILRVPAKRVVKATQIHSLKHACVNTLTHSGCADMVPSCHYVLNIKDCNNPEAQDNTVLCPCFLIRNHTKWPFNTFNTT